MYVQLKVHYNEIIPQYISKMAENYTRIICHYMLKMVLESRIIESDLLHLRRKSSQFKFHSK